MTNTIWPGVSASLLGLCEAQTWAVTESEPQEDGTIFPVELRTILSRDDTGQPTAMWAIVRDITVRKRIEESLRRSHDELELLVAERTRDLSRTIDELQKENLQRRQAEEALSESEKQLRLLAVQLLDAQEQERKRLASELHDELGHGLLTLKLSLGRIAQQLPPDQGIIKKSIQDQLDYFDDIIEEVRRLYHNLSPGDLEDLGLTCALKNLVEEFAETQPDIKWQVHLPELAGCFPLLVQTIIYRLVQEALTNIGKHAQASMISIWAHKENGFLHLVIGDDGRGFDLFQSKEDSMPGLGLAAMQERLYSVGGSFDIWSQKEQGTKLTFIIPCQEKSVYSKSCYKCG